MLNGSGKTQTDATDCGKTIGNQKTEAWVDGKTRVITQLM